ncbi:MAG: UDP-N-acetylglucosamine 2-epimerase (non-hydrolyzing), partial [Myxococcota bacterium]
MLLVLGTRPEIIKLAPVSWALEEEGVPCVTVSSGQHPDLVTGLARDLGIGIDVDLAVGSPPRSPSEMVEAILARE